VRILQDALLKKTDLFIAVTHSEDTNITAAILAKRFGALKTIARIDNLIFWNIPPSNFSNRWVLIL
jgi:trk system potassium uptake protein